jgi:hypothetical protein
MLDIAIAIAGPTIAGLLMSAGTFAWGKSKAKIVKETVVEHSPICPYDGIVLTGDRTLDMINHLGCINKTEAERERLRVEAEEKAERERIAERERHEQWEKKKIILKAEAEEMAKVKAEQAAIDADRRRKVTEQREAERSRLIAQRKADTERKRAEKEAAQKAREAANPKDTYQIKFVQNTKTEHPGSDYYDWEWNNDAQLWVQVEWTILRNDVEVHKGKHASRTEAERAAKGWIKVDRKRLVIINATDIVTA